MKKQSVVIIVVLIVVVVVLGGWYLLSRNKNSTSSNSSNSTSSSMNMPSGSSSSNSTSGQTPQATNAVTIKNYAFSPADITVKQGTTVTWTNKDSVAHTVTETDGQTGGPKSGNINPGSSYTFTFSKPGTYHYHCSIHPEMTGTVTVTS